MDLFALYKLIETACLVGLLYSLVTIGLSLSFRVLNYPDLTLEGSLIFGGALSFLAMQGGLHPVTGLLLGFIGGSLAGILTALLYLYCRVSKLLSGIVSTAILYSINIRLLGGRSNVRLIDIDSFFALLNPTQNRFGDLLILASILFVVFLLCNLLFKTRLGLLIRTMGDAEHYVIALGENPKLITILGLAIANAIIGLGGAVLVNYKNTCDVNMSFGLFISGLAAMVLGETFIASRKIWQHISGSILGTIAYNLAIAIVLFSWSSDWEKLILASDVRLFTGVLLIVPAIINAKRKGKFQLFKSDW